VILLAHLDQLSMKSARGMKEWYLCRSQKACFTNR
jgi:hypothetical protein